MSARPFSDASTNRDVRQRAHGGRPFDTRLMSSGMTHETGHSSQVTQGNVADRIVQEAKALQKRRGTAGSQVLDASMDGSPPRSSSSNDPS